MRTALFANCSTHSFDFEQRLIGLTYTANVPGQLGAMSPPNANIAPPGYYMVFIINQNGVPSVANFTHLTANPTNRPPSGMITLPRGDMTIQPGQSVNFGSTATDPNGTVSAFKWVFPGGTPATSTEGDGVQVATRSLARTQATLNWSTAGYAAGEHTLTAEVYDYEGHEGKISETVTFTK